MDRYDEMANAAYDDYEADCGQRLELGERWDDRTVFTRYVAAALREAAQEARREAFQEVVELGRKVRKELETSPGTAEWGAYSVCWQIEKYVKETHDA